MPVAGKRHNVSIGAARRVRLVMVPRAVDRGRTVAKCLTDSGNPVHALLMFQPFPSGRTAANDHT
jgi:hypothetical protein